MGAFKPLLPVGGQPAILRDIQTASEAGVYEIIVVTGHLREQLETTLSAGAQRARLVYNNHYRSDMLTSVRAGVSELPANTDGFFLLPADCCAVRADTLISIVDRFTRNGGESVAHPVYNGYRGHPPLIPARYADRILSDSRKDGLKEILVQLPSEGVEVNDPCILLDMDTPEDYAALLDSLDLKPYPEPVQSMELLNKYGTPADIIEHGRQVARLALKIAQLIADRAVAEPGNSKINMPLLESACLLHDIRRMDPDHARSGMELLLREGYPKAAMIVGSHTDLPVPALDTGETELLYLADKLSRHGDNVTLDETIRELESKFSQDQEAFANAERRIKTAMMIMDSLASRYDIGYKDIFSGE